MQIQRPSAYLDAQVRAAISSFWKVGDITPNLEKLRYDLDSGAWQKKFGDILQLDERDCGYRLVVAP